MLLRRPVHNYMLLSQPCLQVAPCMWVNVIYLRACDMLHTVDLPKYKTGTYSAITKTLRHNASLETVWRTQFVVGILEWALFIDSIGLGRVSIGVLVNPNLTHTPT